MFCAFALAVRSVASTAAGDIVLGGCVDDRGALARWRDPEVAAFLTARPGIGSRPSSVRMRVV